VVELVVDRLEVVDVEQDQRRRQVVAPAARDLLAQALEEEAVVPEPRLEVGDRVALARAGGARELRQRRLRAINRSTRASRASSGQGSATKSSNGPSREMASAVSSGGSGSTSRIGWSRSSPPDSRTWRISKPSTLLVSGWKTTTSGGCAAIRATVSIRWRVVSTA